MERIIHASTSEELEQVRALFREYAGSLDFGLHFQDFDTEVAGLPGEYRAPAGCILLAVRQQKAAGCVALRPLGPGICEMKRLYVKPEFRGHRIGRELAEAIVEEARRLGYTRMRLDTVRSMTRAIGIYESLGFARIDAYRHNPLEEVCYMEFVLE